MNDVLIIVPTTVTLADVADVLARSWSLDEEIDQPSVVLDPYERAYVTELDVTPQLEEEIFLEDPVTPDLIKTQFGDYRLLALRYTSPRLARAMAQAIASSELADQPMLLDADGTFLSARDFLARLAEKPDWDWFSDVDAQV